jgi:hypothetical protein
LDFLYPWVGFGSAENFFLKPWFDPEGDCPYLGHA